jgi:hypothetical protein
MLEKADYLQIKKRASICVRCGKPFTEDEACPSILLETGEPLTKPPEVAEITPVSVENVVAPENVPTPAPVVEVVAPKKKAADAAVAEPEEEAFHRMDYCAACWNELKEHAYFSYWVGKPNAVNGPAKKLNRAERNIALVALFDSLSDRNGVENDYTPHLFFLAHLLMQYRIFKWIPALRDPQTGSKTLQFTRSDSEEPVLIPDMDLPDDMIVTIKTEIEQYLERSTGQVIQL